MALQRVYIPINNKTYNKIISAKDNETMFLSSEHLSSSLQQFAKALGSVAFYKTTKLGQIDPNDCLISFTTPANAKKYFNAGAYAIIRLDIDDSFAIMCNYSKTNDWIEENTNFFTLREQKELINLKFNDSNEYHVKLIDVLYDKLIGNKTDYYNSIVLTNPQNVFLSQLKSGMIINDKFKENNEKNNNKQF